MPTSSKSQWLVPALALVGAVTVLRWLLLAFNRTDLFVDESQYWLWGQHFDFGYYSKPPLIAWVIEAVTSLAGSDSPFWVRFPAAGLHGATALILAAWAARLYAPRTAVLVALAYVTLPMASLGSLLISTDTVMAPFFAAALYFHRRLIESHALRHAALAGAMAGIACLAKYAGAYFLAGVAITAMLRRDQRITLRETAVMLLAFLAVISPNLYWNLENHFNTLSHTMDNVGWVRQGNPLAGLHFTGPVLFLASQFAVFGPVLFAALLVKLREPRESPALAGFVWFPVLVVTLQSLLDKAYANWAVAAYFAGTLLAVAAMQSRPRLLAASFVVNIAIAILLPVLTLMPALEGPDGRPLLARYLGRADLSQQLLALSQQNGGLPIYADDRDVLADLFYTGRDAGVAFYAPRPKARAMNHYEQSYPLPTTLTGPVLYVSQTPPTCPATAQPALNLAGGAYAKGHFAAYVLDAGCLNAP